jgi:hypothetical protein
MVLGEELDLRGQGGTIRKLTRVSSTRWDGGSLLVPVCFDMILRFLGKKGARGVYFLPLPRLKNDSFCKKSLTNSGQV